MTVRPHSDPTADRWHALSLPEQMGNVGSEVYRASRWRGQNDVSFQKACDRTLELLDLTITDLRWARGRRELTRVREVFCDLFFGSNYFRTDAKSFQTYFDQFAVAARARRSG